MKLKFDLKKFHEDLILKKLPYMYRKKYWFRDEGWWEYAHRKSLYYYIKRYGQWVDTDNDNEMDALMEKKWHIDYCEKIGGKAAWLEK